LTKVNGSAVTFPLATNANVTTVAGTCGSVAGDSPTINVTVTGTSSQSGTATCAANVWTYTTSPTLSAEGSYTVTATQADTAGNTGTSGGKVITIDKTAPGQPTAVSLANGGGQGNAYININNVSSVSVSVTVAEISASDTVNVTISDGTHTATGSTAAGAATVTVAGIDTSALTDGTGNITITATETDAAGNISSAKAAATTYNKDVVAPTITALASANKTGGTANKAEAGDTITATFSETLASLAGTSSNVVMVAGSGNSGPVTVSVPGLGSSAFQIGKTANYMAKNSGNVNFNSSTLDEPNANQVRVTFATASGSGTLTTGTFVSGDTGSIAPATSITDLAGNAASGTFAITISFF
jgi:hypothetical protein